MKNSKFRPWFATSAVSAIVLSLSPLVSAATFTWDGGGVDANSATIANWDPDATVTANSDIIFNVAGVSGTTINWTSGNIFSMTFGSGASAYTMTNASGFQFNQANAGTVVNNSSVTQTFGSGVSVFFTGTKVFAANTGNLSFAAVTFRNDTMSAGQTNSLNLTGASNGEITGIISNSGTWTQTAAGFSSALTKTGSGTWTLSAANTFTGATSVSAGVLALTNNLALQNSPLDISGTGSVTLTGTTPTFGGLKGATNLASGISSGYSGVTALTLNLLTGTTSTYTGSISNGAAGMTLTKNGAGTQILSGASTYTGATTLSAGVLQTNIADVAGVSGALGNGGNITFTGGTLQYSALSAATDYAGRFKNSSSAITLDTNSQSISLAGIIDSSNVGGLVKTGAGTLALAGANAYTGKTQILNGTLSVASIKNVSGGASNLGAPTSAATGTIDIGSTTTGGALTYTGTGDTTDRIINLSGTTGGATLTQSGVSGLLKFTSPFTATGANAKTLTLAGSTAATGEIGGAIVDGATGATTASSAFALGATTITLASVTGLTTGTTISGTGIAASTTVTAINTTTRVVTLSTATTGAGTAAQVINAAGIIGATAVTKSGTGQWTLSGANTYTGATTINGGTLLLNKTGTGAISATSALVLNGGNFSLLGAASGATTQTVASLAANNLTGGSIIVNPNGGTSTTLAITSNTLAGTGGVNFNTSAGTPSTAIVAWNPTLTNGIIGGAYTITDNGGRGFANITAAKVTRFTTGTVLTTTNPTVAATNFLTNTTGTITNTVAAPALNTLSVDTTAGFNSWDLVSGNTATIATGAIVMTGANNFSILNGTLKSNTATNSNLIINQYGAGTMTIGSVIANGIGTSTVTKNGSGTLVLSGANTYTGNTAINGGTLLNGSATTFTNKGSVTMTSTGVLDLGGFNAAFTNIGTNTTSNAITNNGAADAILTSNALGSTINALVTDGSKKLGFIFGPNNNSGTNAFNLANNNTFSGGIVLAPDTATTFTNTNRLRVTGSTISGNPFGTGPITIGVTAADRAGMLFDALTGTNTIANEIIVNTLQGPETTPLQQQGIRVDSNASNVTFTGQLTAGLTNVSFAGNGAATATGKITGVTNGFQTTGSVAITLNNTAENNDYAGNTLVQGTSKITLGRANQIPNASPVTISGGTLDVAGFSNTVGAVSMTSGTISGSGGVLTGTSYALETGSVSAVLGGSSAALTKTTAGTVTLSGVNTYTGATLVNAGTLTLSSAGSIASSSGIQVGSSATYNVSAVSGYTVGSTQTLSGGGSVTGATIISGTHSPGVTGVANGVGTQTFSSTLNYSTGSIFEWNLNAVSAADPGAASSNAATGTYDQVVAAGAVTGGDVIFKIVLSGNSFSDAFWTTDKSWSNIYSGAGTPSNLAAVFSSFSPTGGLDSTGLVTGVGQFSFNGSTSTLNWTAVPEPTSALAGLLITAGLLRRRRSA